MASSVHLEQPHPRRCCLRDIHAVLGDVSKDGSDVTDKDGVTPWPQGLQWLPVLWDGVWAHPAFRMSPLSPSQAPGSPGRSPQACLQRSLPFTRKAVLLPQSSKFRHPLLCGVSWDPAEPSPIPGLQRRVHTSFHAADTWASSGSLTSHLSAQLDLSHGLGVCAPPPIMC